MMAAQAFDLRRTTPQGLPGALYGYTRQSVDFHARDRVLSFDLEDLTRRLTSNEGLLLLTEADPALSLLMTGPGRRDGAWPEVRTSSAEPNVIYATNRV